MLIVETERLLLRTFSLDDADFVLRLVNDPSWIEFIGNHMVENLEDACNYIRNGPLTMYEDYGFSLCVTESKADGRPIGVCGLVKRDSLPEVDLGFALLPEFCGHGYGSEAAAGILEFGHSQLRIQRVLAITKPENHRSVKLLESLGFKFVDMFSLSDEEPELKLFARDS
jgi:RimJ/RimL family protein N-acetyltransferase